MSEKLNLKDRFITMGWVFKQAWRMDKRILIVWGLLSIAFSVLPAIMLGLNRNVIKIITDFIVHGTGSFLDIVWPVMVLGIVLISVKITNRFNSDFFNEIMYDSYGLGLQELMMDSVQKIPLKQFLNKEFNDEYMFIGSRYLSMVRYISSFCEITGKVVGLGSLLIVAAGISPVIFWVATGFILIAVVLTGIISRPTATQWVKIRDFYRVADYYGDMPMSPSLAKEIRLYESEEHVIDRFTAACKITAKYEKQQSFSQEISVLYISVCFYVFLAGIIVYSLYQVNEGLMGVDIFLMLYTLCINLFNMCDTLMHKISGLSFNLYGNMKIRHFIKAAEAFKQSGTESELPLDKQTVLECRDLGFSYDDKKQVLSDISFKIEKGDVVALVGLNGSGKTTLTQLLLGLYQPNHGKILLYGRPISQYNPKFLRDTIGVFFQNINLFHLSMGENVGFGDIENIKDTEKILTAIKKGGAEKILARMDNGLDSMINRDVDKSGYILSGGEQQRVAVSRAHMSDK